MADIKALRNKAVRLEQELKRLEKERNDSEAEIHRMYQEKMDEMEKDFKKLRQEDKKAWKQAYETLKADMLQIQDQKLNALRNQSENLQARRESLLNKIEQLRQELLKEQKELIADKKTMEQIGKDVIRDLSSQFSDCMKELNGKPHEFFFPGDLDLIKSRGPQINHAVKCNMYQAAAAMMLAAETEAQLLKIRTEKEFQEWMEMFTDYKALVDRLSDELHMYSRLPLETPIGSFKLTEDELNFWSMNLYDKMAKTIVKMKQVVDQLESMNLEQYLKKGGAPKGYEFRKLLKRLEDLEQSLMAVMEGIGAERFYSDERKASAKKTKDMMGEHGYECLKDGFVQAEGEENPMDSYEMVFCLNPYDQVFARFVPIRKHGIAVGNQCLLWMDMQTFPEQKLVHGILDVNRDRLKELLSFPIETEGTDFDEHSFTESQLKKQADLEKYEQFRRKNRRKGDLRV